MRKVLLIIAAGVVVGCGKEELPESQRHAPSTPKAEVENTDSTKASPEKLITDPVVEKAIRRQLSTQQPEGELTMAHLEKVKWFNHANEINDEGLRDVAKLTQLERLSLYRTKITDKGLKELADLTHLKRLDLGKTKITDAGLKEVVKFAQLEQLQLDNTSITDAGLKELAKLPKLTVLSLDGSKITDAGLKELTGQRRSGCLYCLEPK